MGRLLALRFGLRALVRRFAAADMVAAAPVAASAVVHAELSGLSVEVRGVVVVMPSGAAGQAGSAGTLGGEGTTGAG